MADRPMHCPHCESLLVRGERHGLAAWECRNGDGVGIFLLEAYRRLQRDELEALLAGCKTAPLSSFPSPISGVPMAEVTFHVDDDLRGGPPGVNSREMVVEVDPVNYFGWFQIEELDAMPKDHERKGPASHGMIGIDQMDEHIEAHNGMFDRLTPADFGSPNDDRGISRLFTGVARRLRS